MMKSLVVLSCLVAVALGGSVLPLSGITTQALTLTLTANQLDAFTAPTLTAITYPTTYDSSAAVPAAFNFAGAGTHTLNNTVAGIVIVFSSGSDSVTCEAQVSGVTDTAFTVVGSCNPKFLVTGTYTPVVTVGTALGRTYVLTGNAASVAATRYQPPAFTAISFGNASTSGCDATACTDSPAGAATLAPGRANTGASILLRPSSANLGVVFAMGTGFLAAGTSNFDTQGTPLTTAVAGGGIVSIVQAGATILAQNAALAVSAVITEVDYSTYVPESFFTGGVLQNTVTYSGGAAADTTPPACTVAQVSPTAITTFDSAVPVTITLTCADAPAGTSGLWVKGLFVTTPEGGGVVRFPTAATADLTFPVPAHVSATYTINGAFAIDNAGNSVLYGSCAGVAGYDSIGCAAGGSSSASTVSLSLFAMVVVALFALFA